jgi:hypothetical protein
VVATRWILELIGTARGHRLNREGVGANKHGPERSTKTIAAASVRGRGGCRALIAGLVASLAVLSAASCGYGVERANRGRQR